MEQGLAHGVNQSLPGFRPEADVQHHERNCQALPCHLAPQVEVLQLCREQSDMLSRCSCSRLRFRVFSSGGNLNRKRERLEVGAALRPGT